MTPEEKEMKAMAERRIEECREHLDAAAACMEEATAGYAEALGSLVKCAESLKGACATIGELKGQSL